MAALTTIPDHYTTEFETNWTHKAQQMEDRLKQYVEIRNYTGERMRCNLVNPDDDPTLISERAGATEHTDLGTENRWIYTKGWQMAHLIDEWDDELLGEVTGPNSDVLKAMMASFARHCDSRIIEAATETAYTGKEGTSTQDFDDTNQKIAVDYVETGSATDSNLTIGKLRRVMEIFGENEVYGQDLSGFATEPVVMAVAQSQLTSLLRTTEVTSTDFNTVKALVSGEVDTFLGIKFVRTQRLAIDANNVRTCLAWVRSGIKFSQGDHRVDIDTLPERSHATQIRVRCRNGGVRTEEKKVIKVLCDEDL